MVCTCGLAPHTRSHGKQHKRDAIYEQSSEADHRSDQRSNDQQTRNNDTIITRLLGEHGGDLSDPVPDVADERGAARTVDVQLNERADVGDDFGSTQRQPGEEPGAAELFARTPKLYLQALEYGGPYRFAGDLLLDLRDARPFAWKVHHWARPDEGGFGAYFPGFSTEEVQDYCEANAASPLCEGWASPGVHTQR